MLFSSTLGKIEEDSMRKMLNQIKSSARHRKAETTLGSYISRIQDTLHQAKEDKIDIETFFLK